MGLVTTTSLDELKRKLDVFKSAKKTLIDLVTIMINDTSLPLDVRWDFFEYSGLGTPKDNIGMSDEIGDWYDAFDADNYGCTYNPDELVHQMLRYVNHDSAEFERVFGRPFAGTIDVVKQLFLKAFASELLWV